METSTAPLARASSLTPRRIVDDPRALDDDQLRELLRAAQQRSFTVGVATGGVTVALTAVLAPLTAIGAFAAVPAFGIGYVLATRLTRRAQAAQHGVTPRCLAVVERALERASLRRDVRSLKPREWVATDWDTAVTLVRHELDRAGIVDE